MGMPPDPWLRPINCPGVQSGATAKEASGTSSNANMIRLNAMTVSTASGVEWFTTKLVAGSGYPTTDTHSHDPVEQPGKTAEQTP
jgi:hypothetical protein